VVAAAADEALFGPVEAWSTLGGQAVDPRGVTVLQGKQRKAGVWRLSMQSGPQVTVIAKRCLAREAQCERVVYEHILPAAGVTSLQYFGSIPDPDNTFAWVFVEDTSGSDYAPQSAVHRRLAAEWLGRLHSGAASLANSVPLPDRGLSHYRGYLDAIRELAASVACDASLSSDERQGVESLRQCADELDRRWSDVCALDSRWPPTLVHGSFSHRNMRVRDNRLLVFDWGAAGWGSAARDVVKLVGAGIGGDATVYREACSLHPRADETDLGNLLAVGGVLRGLEHLSWVVPKLQYEWRDGVIETIERHIVRVRESVSRLDRSDA
jgi:hypothetical protein